MSNSLFLFEEEGLKPEEQGAKKPAKKTATVDVKNSEGKTSAKNKTAPSFPEIMAWKPTKQYVSISEVAKNFGLNVSHIRHWTTEFQLQVRTNKKGDRLYTEAPITQLKKIYKLVKIDGMTLPGAKIKLQQDHKAINTDELIEALTQLKSQLSTLAKQL